MSELPETILADGNSAAARRARVKLQPRDRKGRWIPTGASIFAMIKGLGGSGVKKYNLKAIGGTATKKGEKNKIRALLTADAPDLGLRKNTVVEIDPANGELDTQIKLDRDFLKRKGIDPDLQHTLPSTLGKKFDKVEDINPKPADDLDIELANNGLTDDEDKDFRAERDQEPLAKLPPGMEELSKDELDALTRGGPKAPSDVEKPAGKPPRFPGDKGVPEPTDVSDKPKPPSLDEMLWLGASPAKIEDPKEVFDNPFGNWEKPSVQEYNEAMEKPLESMTDEELAKVIAYSQNFARRDPREKNINDFAIEEARRRKLNSDISPEEKAVREKVAEAFYGGEIDPDPEVLLREVARDGEVPRKRTAAAGLEPGDVIRNAAGEEDVVIGVSNVPGSGANQVEIKVQRENGEIVTVTGDADRPMSVWGPKRRVQRPAAPAAEEAPETDAPEAEAPEAPETSEAPEAPETPEADDSFDSAEEVQAESLVPPNFPPTDRIDDGSDFDIENLSEARRKELRGRKLNPVMDADGTPAMFLNENNELTTAEDPFEIMNALAEAYPNAKFTEDGMALVLHRQKDKDGKIFEVRASNSGKKALVYTMRWTDPETGEVEEFQYKNDAHSISAALGKYDAEYLLDRVLGRKPEFETLKFGNSSAGMNDTLRKRVEVGFMGSKDPSNTRRKLVGLKENAIRLALGRNAVYHKDGTQKDSEIPSLWDTFDSFIEDRDAANKEDFYHVLYSIFGRAPMDERSHAEFRSALREEFSRRYKGKLSNKDTRAFHGLVTSASERMRGIYRDADPNVRAIRYASKDRTRAIEPGMTVEYTNNVGDKSTVRVTKLVKNTGAQSQGGDIYDFGDYVIIQDADGTSRKINALKLQILSDQNADLSTYIPNLSGQALRDRREELGVFTPSAPDELPGQNSVVSDVPEGPKMVDDIVAGDILPNKQGQPIGEVIAVKPITSRSGNPGFAFLVRKPDGEEVRVNYAQGTELELKKA
jgi:hypothetical protein